MLHVYFLDPVLRGRAVSCPVEGLPRWTGPGREKVVINLGRRWGEGKKKEKAGSRSSFKGRISIE